MMAKIRYEACEAARKLDGFVNRHQRLLGAVTALTLALLLAALIGHSRTSGRSLVEDVADEPAAAVQSSEITAQAPAEKTPEAKK